MTSMSTELLIRRAVGHESPTNEDEIVTAGKGQAQIHCRKYRDESCMCTGVEAPNGVFTNTRSRSSSRAPEARNGSEKEKATTSSRDTRMRSRSSSRAPEAHNGSDSSKANSKKAKDTEKSSSLPLRLEPKLMMMISIGKMSNTRNQEPFQSITIIHFALKSFPASFAQAATN